MRNAKPASGGVYWLPEAGFAFRVSHFALNTLDPAYMPLLSCRECRESVSSEAPFCPHCGVPQPAAMEAPESPWTGLLYIGSNGGVAAIRPDDGDEVWRTPLGGFFSGPGKNDV